MANSLQFQTVILPIKGITNNFDININYCRIGNLFGHRFEWIVESPHLTRSHSFNNLKDAIEKAFTILYHNEDVLKESPEVFTNFEFKTLPN